MKDIQFSYVMFIYDIIIDIIIYIFISKKRYYHPH
jgi:hypothetical protein